LKTKILDCIEFHNKIAKQMKWKYKLKTDVKKIDANVYFNNLVIPC